MEQGALGNFKRSSSLSVGPIYAPIGNWTVEQHNKRAISPSAGDFIGIGMGKDYLCLLKRGYVISDDKNDPVKCTI